jgi:hypothetical protein
MSDQDPEQMTTHIPNLIIDGFDFSKAFVTAQAVTATPMAGAQITKRFHKAARLISTLSTLLADHPNAPTPAIAEAGVWRGFSAHIMAQYLVTKIPGWQGHGMHLIDSFAGLRQPQAEDIITDKDGQQHVTKPRHNFQSSVADVKSAFTDFPNVTIHAGWIPEVFDSLPDLHWLFVHIDTDHYQPVRDSLNYFMPEMQHGSAVLNDDYGSALFPGAKKAWDEVCLAHGLTFDVFDTGQALLRRNS